MSDLQVTPASEFKKMRLRGVSLTLPSGRNVRLRGLDPTHFMEELEGAPQMFQDFINKLFWTQDSYAPIVQEFLKPRETAQETADLVISMGIVAKKCLLEPRVVETPQTDDDTQEIALSDLFPGELNTLTFLAFQPHDVLYWVEENPQTMLSEFIASESSEGDKAE